MLLRSIRDNKGILSQILGSKLTVMGVRYDQLKYYMM